MKAVIFDLDGVLIDSQPFHFEVDILVLREAGIECGLEVVQRYAGMANRDRWAKYRKDFSLGKTSEELIEIHVKIMNEYLDTARLEPIDGVRELLEFLAAKKIKLAVASSSSHSFIGRVLRKINAESFFDIITSGEDVPNGKPAPDVFLLAASMLGEKPEDCVIIEDSSNGVAAANAAGIRCIGYVNKSSGEQNLSGADVIIDSYRNPEGWIF